MEKTVGIFLAQLNHRTGLKQPHFFNHIENDVRKFVYSVGTVGLDSAKIYKRKVGVRIAFFGGNADFWWRRMIVKFYPESFQKLEGSFFRQGSVGYAFLVKRIKMLVEPSRVKGIPGIYFGNDSQMDKPVILQGFVERLRRMGRNVFANPGYFFQFGFTHRIFFQIS